MVPGTCVNPVTTRCHGVKIGPLALGKRPVVVLAVQGDAPALARVVREGADILEARVDAFKRVEPASVARVVRGLRRHGRPLIGTVRWRREGGKAALSEEERWALYRAIAPWVEAMDVELRATGLCERVIALAHRLKRTVIVSCHDFRRTPPVGTLERWGKQAAARGADVIKIATLCRHERDLLRLLDFTLAHRHRGRPLVTIAIGPLGTPSRVLFPLAGSALTYTNVVPQHGQLPLRELVADLRRYVPAYHHAYRHRPLTIPLPLQGERMKVRGFTPLPGSAAPLQRALTGHGRKALVTGFTMMEVVLAVFALAVAIAAVLGAFTTQITLNEHTRNLSLATQDAARVMEAIRDLNTGAGCTTPSVVSPVGTRWDDWLVAAAPAGAGGRLLAQQPLSLAAPIPELIVVTCQDNATLAECRGAQFGTSEWHAPGPGGTAYDPIRVTVAVCWRHRGRVIGECTWNEGTATLTASDGANGRPDDDIIDSPASITTVITCRTVSP